MAGGRLLAVIFWQVASRWSILCGRSGASAPPAVAGESGGGGVVNEPVEDGVGISRIANEGVPFVDGDLTGEDGRATPIALLEDLVEVTTGAGVERFKAPIAGVAEMD